MQPSRVEENISKSNIDLPSPNETEAKMQKPYLPKENR
jgi:hypothetical protein